MEDQNLTLLTQMGVAEGAQAVADAQAVETTQGRVWPLTWQRLLDAARAAEHACCDRALVDRICLELVATLPLPGRMVA